MNSFIDTLKSNVVNLLNHQKGQADGFFKFSYSGDLYSENEKWGLAASAFAAKLYQMTGLLATVTDKQRERWAEFILSFENEAGEIYDPLVIKKSALRNKLSAVRRGYFGNFFNQESKRAETRQAHATLEILNAKPKRIYARVPRTTEEVEKFIRSLNWQKNPWNAASHAGQLISFYAREARWFKSDTQELFQYALACINKLQSTEDGSWHANSRLSNSERVNAAMKIITGLVAALPTSGQKWPTFAYPEKLIDLCLGGEPDKEACSNVDRIYVLYWASRLTDHRKADIKAFAEKKLQQYQENLRPEGGFSFYPNQAQYYYLGARLTKGLNEPDMQGSALSVWGIALLTHLLEFSENERLTLPNA